MGQNDLIARIRRLSPDNCPQSVLIVNHGVTIRGILREVGYTGPELPADLGPLHFSRMGFLYNIFILPDGRDIFTRLDFGVREGLAPAQTPCLPPVDEMTYDPTKLRQKVKVTRRPPTHLKKMHSQGSANKQCEVPHLYTIRHVERYGIGFIERGDGSGYAANYGAMLTGPGFEHTFELIPKFQNASLPLDLIYVNVGYNYQTGQELARATGLPIHVFYSNLEIFPAPVIESYVIERISRLDPCPEGVLVISHGAAVQYPIMQDYGWTGPQPPDMNQFGAFHHLQKLGDGSVILEASDFGGHRGTADPPRPCNP